MSELVPVMLKAKEAEESTQGSTDEKQQTVVNLSQFTEPCDSAPPVLSFAVEKHQRNTENNPLRENTNILPIFVRRVDSEELLPAPFKTTNQLLCASYLSAICCVYIGTIAVNLAWKVKQKRNAGILSGAAKDAKVACLWMKVAVAVGMIIVLPVIVVVVVYCATGNE